MVWPLLPGCPAKFAPNRRPDTQERAPTVEVLFLLFAVVSTSVLGLLCLVVLEYQNGKARRWNRLWSEYRTDARPESQGPLSSLEPSATEALPTPEYEYEIP